jgi:hypothetical protein
MSAAQSPGSASDHKDELPSLDLTQVHIISDHEARESLGHSQIDVGKGSKTGSSGVTGAATSASTALPLWSYSATATQNSTNYSGQIVGTNPSTNTTTTVPAVIVPLIIKITQGGTTYTFDPTAPDSSCLGGSNTAFALMQSSPIFSDASFTINGVSEGSTQYGDAILRAEFNTTTKANTSYHLLLSSTASSTPLTISVNAGYRSGNSTGAVYSVGTQCGNSGNTNRAGTLAVVNINTVDAALQSYISAHGLNASQFPFFVTYNAVMSEGPANNTAYCCVLGYHNALGSPGQTYGIAEFEGRDQTVFSGVSDVAAASHEVNEWINDPSGNNPTPAWGNVGQVSGCQSNFEVGDPLSGTLMPTVSANGFNYHLQELAFYSWFYGGTSLGAGGKYSSNGTFQGAAKLCPPGGTN